MRKGAGTPVGIPMSKNLPAGKRPSRFDMTKPLAKGGKPIPDGLTKSKKVTVRSGTRGGPSEGC